MKVICNKCGRQYDDGIHIVSSINVKLSNNKSQCPYCGNINGGVDGTFDFDQNGNIIKKFLTDAHLTRDELISLKNLLTSNNIDTQNIPQIQEQAAAINPKLFGLFDLPLNNSDKIAIIAIILQVIAILISTFGAGGTTNNITINNFSNNIERTSFKENFEKKMREKNLRDIESKKAFKRKK